MCVKAPYNACVCNLNLCVEEPPSQDISSISTALSVHPPQEGGGDEPGLITKQQLGIELTPSKAVTELIHKQKSQNLCTPLCILLSATIHFISKRGV